MSEINLNDPAASDSSQQCLLGPPVATLEFSNYHQYKRGALYRVHGSTVTGAQISQLKAGKFIALAPHMTKAVLNPLTLAVREELL